MPLVLSLASPPAISPKRPLLSRRSRLAANGYLPRRTAEPTPELAAPKVGGVPWRGGVAGRIMTSAAWGSERWCVGEREAHRRTGGRIAASAGVEERGCGWEGDVEGKCGSSNGDAGGICAARFKYMMVLAYDGTDFYGWQRQAHRPTVQGAVEAALGTYTKESRDALAVLGASRTDAGVHAWGQVAHFTTTSPICDLPRMHRALNALLPPAIRVRSLRPVPRSFHARLLPVGKCYHYSVLNCRVPHLLPHRRATVLSYTRGLLDRGRMAEGARLFVGRRDFGAFANACEAKEKGAVREITRFELVGETDCWLGAVDPGEPSPVFRFEVEGTGFLYRQVRNMVGLLLQIGVGALPPAIVTDLLLSGDRRQLARVAATAKAQGLALMRVDYPPSALVAPPGSPPPSLSYFEP
ncbi:hypothetical protein CLOM_g17832 [Closterium sp. NIES-68]|nr:hypothetical protein CLOM_g17832 [Closterium sp. NIES-68]